MNLDSHFKALCAAPLPYMGRQKYMHTFDTDSYRMAEGFEDYRGIVQRLCVAAGHSGTAHMTVDERVIAPGFSQRRPGAHVDGRFMAEENSWGHPPGPPHWLHYCNDIRAASVPRMGVIVAASVAGCIAYSGRFAGQPSIDGDLEHIRGQLPDGVLLEAGMGYLLSPDCVHESVRFQQETQRTFLRIALEPR